MVNTYDDWRDAAREIGSNIQCQFIPKPDVKYTNRQPVNVGPDARFQN